MDPRLLFALLALMSLAFAGCTDDGDSDQDGMEDLTDDAVEGGGNDTADPPSATATVTYEGVYGAPAGNSYTQSITVVAGAELTVTFENNDQNQAVSHDWYLEALDVGTEVIGAGETTSVTFLVDLEPGDYVYYCTIGNGSHRENGMEGTLTVTAA